MTDETFDRDVMQRSEQVPVVVDLWAEWCGPCRTLGPILERVIDATDGRVVLAKVDTDANPRTSAMFAVQSIPAVYAVANQEVVDSFVGARGEREVQQFVERLVPSPEQERVAALVAAGDEASLRQAVELVPGDETAVLALAGWLVDAGETTEALDLLERIPETAVSRQLAARARLADSDVGAADPVAIAERLGVLLDEVKTDPDAHTEFLDLLELLGPTDPTVVDWRRKLTTRLF